MLTKICKQVQAVASAAYAFCNHVLDALAANGNNVRYWLMEGCYKYEIYEAKEWVKPCPSHVMCSALMNGESKPAPFCKAVPMENPFKSH